MATAVHGGLKADASGDDGVDEAVKAAFGEALVKWEQVGETLLMGFSGASIRTLQCTLSSAPDLPVLTVLKRTQKQTAALAADAEADGGAGGGR